MNFPIFAFPFNIYSYTFCRAALAAALMFLALPDVMAAGPADTSVTASGWYRHGRALAGQLPLHSPSGRYGLEPYPDHGYMDTVDGSPLFFDLSAASDTRMALGVSSSLSSGRKWSTEILGGLTGNVKSFDCNHDGFMDEPEVFRFNVANSWHYCADDGVRVSFGAGFMRHSGKEGQEGYDHTAYQELEEGYSDDPWGSDLAGMMADGYVSIYVPLADMQRLNNWSADEVSAVELTLDGRRRSRADMRAKAAEAGMYTGLAATAVTDSYSQLFDWLAYTPALPEALFMPSTWS